MADFDKSIDLDKAFNGMVNDVIKVAKELRQEGQEAGEAVGRGWDDGLDSTVEKIKASSIKMSKAFSNLSEKIRKQVQQLTANVNGKDFKLKIDFSDIDMNADDIKQKVAKIFKDFTTEGLIEFDAKGSEQQFKNLIALYVKYQEKFNALQGVAPNLTSSKDIELNLRQQLMLALKLKEIYSFLDGPSPIKGYSMEINKIFNQLATVQKFIEQTQGGDTKVAGDYDELAKVLKEIQSSLKVISDTFKNENNSMKAMAENGVTSFTSLSQAIIEVYNNLTQVQSLVDTISQKDFNITNVTQVGGGNSNMQAMTQQMAMARETMEHLRQLYDQAGDTLTLLGQGGQVGLVMEYAKQLQELNITEIGKSVKGANSEMKLASVLAEMQDYIDKLIQINELRNKYSLGEWKDIFVPSQNPQAKPVARPEEIKIVTPSVEPPKEATASVDTETTQMSALEGAVDKVSKAIGRKNAGFIKEKEIVDVSVDAEKAKLKELVGVITNEIGSALDNIKDKFAQSFVVPELDKNNLQSSFDEIYNKFVELKDKIKTNGINIGINTSTEGYSENTHYITDPQGKPVEMYRGVRDSYSGLVSNRYHGGTFFTDNIEIAREYAGEVGKIEKVLLSMKNPLEIDGNGANWNVIEYIGNGADEASKRLMEIRTLLKGLDSQLDELWQTSTKINEAGEKELWPVAAAMEREIKGARETLYNEKWSIFEDSTNPYGVKSTNEWVETAKDLGYDGVIFKNIVDIYGGRSEDASNVMVPLNQDQIHYQETIQQTFEQKTQNLREKYGQVESYINMTDEEIDKGLREYLQIIKSFGESSDWRDNYDNFLSNNPAFNEFNNLGLLPGNVLGGDVEGTYRGSFKEISDYVNNARQAYKNLNQITDGDVVAEAIDENTVKTTPEVKITPIMDEGAIANVVAENVKKTPVTVKVTPVINSASDTEQAVDGESQSAADAAKSFVDAANAKKQFVEANKQVAEGAEGSAKAVEEEAKAAEQAKQTMVAAADDTVQPSTWDKIAQLQKDHGEDPFALRRSKTENAGDKSVRTIVESWTAIKDKDGNLTGEMELNTVQIINDFKKRTDAITKESEKIKTAQAYLQKFLTQFNNKTMGEGKKLKGYEDLEKLANSKTFKIDDIAKAEQMMSNLDAEYNKVVQNMRKGSSSMNPFVNAINGIDKMEDVLRGISLQFQTLNQQLEWLKNQIIDLYKQFDNISTETDIYKFAEGFGNLKVSINSVTESIRQQRAEQKLATSDFNALIKATKTRDNNTEKAAKEEDGSAWKTYYLDRAAEQQKIIDAIRIGLVLTEAQEAQLNAMAEKHALILGDITQENNKIEEQKQKYEEIMRLLEKNHADQIELDNDTSLGDSDRSAYQQILNEERAQIEALIASADLNPEQKKSVKGLMGSIEDDRVAKVKEYIDLLKLQYDYEKKAAKEDEGSKMQSFYNEKIAEIKEKIKQIDILAIENQDEKNKRLALEEAHLRAIAEIQQKQEEKQSFKTQNDKLQGRFEAGYLGQDNFKVWQTKLAEYQGYLDGTVAADEETIQKKKTSLIQLYDQLVKMSNASKTFFASGGEILPTWFNQSQIKNAEASLRGLYDSIVTERFDGMTTSITGVNGTLGKLNFVVDDGSGKLTQYTIALDRASGATKLLQNNTKPTLTVLQKFGQSLKKDFTGLLTAIMGGTSIHTFVQYMRKGVESVRQLDLALTELKKVTDETEETYDKFLDTASKTSARIGKTITEMTSATAEFAKLGYDVATAAAMAESALVYANVGDNVDVETGSQSIISTMKAFGIEADNTMSIVDKFNEVGNNFAITTKGIGDALQVSASAMAAAGNTLDETIALTTAANTIVQNPNTVGTALKTLSLRIRGVKTE